MRKCGYLPKMTNNEQVFYDLIYPYGKKDTVENARTIIENIKNQKHYETVLIRCVGYKSKVILRTILEDESLETFKNTIKTDKTKHSGAKLETMKERLINHSLQKGDEDVFQLVCNLFDVNDVIPDYKVLSDVTYFPNMYDNDFINQKSDIVYLTDLERDGGVYHFEYTITSMSNVYYAGNEDEKSFESLKEKFEKVSEKKLDNEEIELIRKFSINYYKFIKDEFDDIIDDIKSSEKKPDSKKDCWGLLFNYLKRDPSDFERDILWDHTASDWYESEEE